MRAEPDQDEPHFDFGRNWADFARSVGERQVSVAMVELEQLVGRSLAGKAVFDIGCGSGLVAVAAARLGAAHVLAIDVDEQAVFTSRTLLERFAPGASWEVRQDSVLNLKDDGGPMFDVVHSWGVLHHTGRLREALRCAAGRVAPGGTFALALYRRSPVDRFWIAEKRFYMGAAAPVRGILRGVFKAAYLAGLTMIGRSPFEYIRTYGAKRGMSWGHDVDDWLGGYPYEPIDIAEVTQILGDLGLVSEFVVERPLQAYGLLGVPCHEYRFVREGNK